MCEIYDEKLSMTMEQQIHAEEKWWTHYLSNHHFQEAGVTTDPVPPENCSPRPEMLADLVPHAH